jgi:hypothetical protein
MVTREVREWIMVADLFSTEPKQREVRYGSMLSKKSFRGTKRFFLKPLMRFVRRDVIDHVVS